MVSVAAILIGVGIGCIIPSVSNLIFDLMIKNNSMILSELVLLTVGIVTTGIGLLIAFWIKSCNKGSKITKGD